jgi:hypothetical protein
MKFSQTNAPFTATKTGTGTKAKVVVQAIDGEVLGQAGGNRADRANFAVLTYWANYATRHEADPVVGRTEVNLRVAWLDASNLALKNLERNALSYVLKIEDRRA